MISFVYFDVGGVLDKDFSASNKWDNLREELGIAPSEAYELFWKEVEKDICTRKEVDDLLPLLEEKFGAKIPADYSLLDSFVKRFEKNELIWPVVRQIQQTAKVGLLTMMYSHMLEALLESGILPPTHWDVIMDSSVVGLVKGDKATYKLAQEKAGVPAEEILYIDNTKRYLDIAQTFGWQTYFYDSSDYEKSTRDLQNFWQALSR